MNRGKIVAIATGAISILIAVAYLMLVFILDTRGEMKPAPIPEMIPVGYSVEWLAQANSFSEDTT